VEEASRIDTTTLTSSGSVIWPTPDGVSSSGDGDGVGDLVLLGSSGGARTECVAVSLCDSEGGSGFRSGTGRTLTRLGLGLALVVATLSECVA
jgi:hypothetical protein